MKKIVVLLALFLLPTALLRAADNQSFGDIKLLDGYHVTRQGAVDVEAGTIEKSGGLRITFESGPSEGAAVKRDKKGKYLWYREQIVKGHKVRLALEEQRRIGKKHLLLVTFLLGGENTAFACNFAGDVKSQEDIADMLLMILTFDPSHPF